MTDHTDLLIRIGTYNQTAEAYPVEARLGDGSFFLGGQLALDQEKLLQTLNSPHEYGSYLTDALFTEQINRAYQNAKVLAGEQGRIRIRLWIDSGAVELHAIRWERLLLPDQKEPVSLTTAGHISFSRYIDLQMAEARPLTAQPIKMLVAVANPANLEQYNIKIGLLSRQ
jgi:hypothetical protein